MIFILALFLFTATLYTAEYVVQDNRSNLAPLECLPKEISDTIYLQIIKPQKAYPSYYYDIAKSIGLDLVSIATLSATSKTLRDEATSFINSPIHAQWLSGIFAHEYCAIELEKEFSEKFSCLFVVQNNIFSKIHLDCTNYYTAKLNDFDGTTQTLPSIPKNYLKKYRCRAANAFYAQLRTKDPQKYALADYALVPQNIETQDNDLDPIIVHNPGLLFDVAQMDDRNEELTRLTDNMRPRELGNSISSNKKNFISWFFFWNDINKPHIDDQTALYNAISWNKPEVVILLLDHPQIDVNESFKYGSTPLHNAVYHGNPEMVKLLLNHPQIDIEKPHTDGETCLQKALKYNYRDIADLLLEHKYKK